MNLEEKNTVDICQEKTSNNASSRILHKAKPEEFLSPTRRSSRIRKPKISNDYCNIDEAIEKKKTNPRNNKEKVKENSNQLTSSAAKSEVNFIDCDKDNQLSESHKSLENSSSFCHVDRDEEESFESMFDDIFGQRYSETLQSLLPKKLNSESIKERKFFKRNSQESPKPNFSGSYSSNSNLPAEDVDKVFKIISKPNILSDTSSDSKSLSKPFLKTYCNKRKSFQKSNVVESFGLPDYPIIADNAIKPNKPILNNKLDVEILDASETILDLPFNNEPWVVTNIEGESLFPFYEEVRFKAEPVKDERVRKNSSFIDPRFMENSDLCNEFNIYTSTPQIVNDKILDKMKCTSLNNNLRVPKTVSKDKEIDIEAIKINFKKILNKKVDKEEFIAKVNRTISPKKKTTTESKHNFSVGNEISFIENDSLTIENKEFEISNVLPVPKQYETKCLSVFKCENKSSKLISSLNCNKMDCESCIADKLKTNDSKIDGKKLTSSSITCSLKAEQQSGNIKVSSEEDLKAHSSSRQTSKKFLKSSGCKNKISLKNKEIIKRDVKIMKSPKKKTQETELVLFKPKHSLRSPLRTKEQQSEKQEKNTQYNEDNKKLTPVKFHESENFDHKRRMLRSSLTNSYNLQSLEANNFNKNVNQIEDPNEKNELINIDDNSVLNHNCTKEFLLNSIIKTETEKLKSLQRNLNSNINLTSEPNLFKATLENNKQINIEKKITEKKVNPDAIVARKRVLRSTSQENLAKKIQEKTKIEQNNEDTQKNVSMNQNEIKTNVKINLEKLKFETDIQPNRDQDRGKGHIQGAVFPTNKNETIKDKRTDNVKPVVISVLRKSFVDTNFPSNYNESLPERSDIVNVMSPLKKGKQSVPEIRIIISPLDISQLGKVPEIPSEVISDFSSKIEKISPTKRKLRSTQAIIGSTDIEKKLVSKLGKECKKLSVNKKPVSKSIGEIKMPGINEETSTKEKGILNNVQTKTIDYMVLESNTSDQKFLDQLLNEDLETDVNTSNKSKFEQAILCNENMFQKNVPKIRTPKKGRGRSSIKTVSNDTDKKTMESCVTVNKFNADNSQCEDSIKQQKESKIMNCKVNKKSGCYGVEASTINTPKKATNSITEYEFNSVKNKDYNHEIIDVLTDSNNIEFDHCNDNIDDKKSSNQEFNSSKSQVKNVEHSSKSIKTSNNLKSDLPKGSIPKVSRGSNNSAINGIELQNQITKQAILDESSDKNDEKSENELKIEDICTTETHNLIQQINIEKHSEIYEKEEIVDQLHIGTATKNRKLNAYIPSNKLVTIKINPCNANNYLTGKEEEHLPKTLDAIKEGLTEEKVKPITLNGDTTKLNDSLDLDVNLLKNIAGNKKVFDKISSVKSSVSIINDLTTEVLKSRLNSFKHSSGEINITDTQFGVDNNTIDQEEMGGQPLENCVTISQNENTKLNDLCCDLVTSLTECEFIQDSEEDCLELTKIFDKDATENEDYLSIKSNHITTTNEVSTSTNSIEINFDDKKQQKLTEMPASFSERNTEKENVENIKIDKNVELLSNKESKQPKEKPTIKVNNELIFSSRLRERKLKSISDQTNSTLLGSPRKTENNYENEVVSTEKSTKYNQLGEYLKTNSNINVKNIPGNITPNRISSSAFSREPNDAKNVLPKNNSQTNIDDFKSEKPLVHKRRKSINDVDLLDTEKERYKDRLRRSKSVIPRAVDSKKKINGQDGSKVMSEKIGTYDDNVDTKVIYNSMLKRSKSVSSLQSRSRNVNRDSVFTEHLKKQDKKLVKKELKEVKEKTKTEDVDLEGEDTHFQVGNIAWAQIGSHPFWPCLVIEDPETGFHMKKINFQGKRNQKILYHVRFFGDNGRRAWINKHQMMLYSHYNDLKDLSHKMRVESNPSSMLRAYIIKPNKLKKWECAVDEAEHLKSKSINEKVSFFTNMFASKAEKKLKQLLSDDNESTNEPNLLKRKRRQTDINYEEKFELSLNTDSTNEKSPVRKKFKRGIPARSVANSPKKDSEVGNASKIENTESLALQNENVLSSRLRLRKQIDEISEIDSKTSSDNTTDIALYSMAFQKALFKRNNLFKGVPRDKVCQYCCESEAVVKCSGRCNGSYHIECATKMLQEKLDGRKKARNTSNNLHQDNETFYGNKIMSNGSKDIKEEEIMERTQNEDNKPILLDNDHVQIITVPSSVYNTPPRKTFPPNFKNMSLAEQIDYKMKEIMKKFESKTFYAESTDSSSEENGLVQPSPKDKNFNRRGDLFPNKSTFDSESKTSPIEQKHVQVLQENEVAKSEPMSDEASTSGTIEKVIEHKNINIKSEKNFKPSKHKPFIAHITADSDSLDESANIVKMASAKKFKCGFCISNLDPFCFICNQTVSKTGSSIRQKCSLYQCGRFYHPHCLKMWPQTQWSLIQTTKHKDSDEAVDSFVCPLHVCHTCASDDPRAATSRCSSDKIVKCLRCPSTYHSTNFCVPAGTTILSSTQIICPRHREKGKSNTINTTWCFLCSKGGNLICCETCPTSVHPECLPVNLTDDDKFICEDCESGRLPLYDEIVWVKLGKFRWWPALILFPSEVPNNIMNIKHATGEFVVKFFGTYDHYWVNRGRSFLFQEGDTGHCNSTKTKVDAAFNKAVEEAVVAHIAKKEFKLSQEAESITSLKPPPYIRIKVNRPVGNVRQLDLDLSSTNACECDPSQPNPCGPDSDCLNRLLLTECSPDVCPAGERCKNRSFDKREYPPLVPYKTQGRGWGLKTLAPIKKGQFVIEYVGEMIDIEEYQRRIQKMHEQKEENYYFLTIDKDRMIDAGPKGNVARFMNHCCQPNCETQKWTVNGDTRVGLFASEDISADTELTFNYNLECVGKEKKVCRCGASNCSGFIGVKAKQDTDSKKPKKSYKKKKPEEPVILPPCFICGKKGEVGVCNNKVCNNAYHLKCLKMTEWPEGNKFICPWHNCNICSKRTIRCCVRCVNSFCPSHSEGNVRYDNFLGFVCTDHDPMEAPNTDEPVKFRKKKNNVITDESAVSSTTADELDEDLDLQHLIIRKCKNKRKKKKVSIDSESENYFEVNKSATSTPKRTIYSDRDSQGDSTVSSATIIDVEESVIVKRKRSKREDQIKKKRKVVNNVGNHETTASSLVKDDNSLRNSSKCVSSSDNELENR